MALWKTDAKLTRSILNALEYNSGAIRHSENGKWKIHGSILGIAKEYLAENEDEFRSSAEWIGRAKEQSPKLTLTSVPGAVFQAYKNRKVTVPKSFAKQTTWIDYFSSLFKHVGIKWQLVKKNSAFFTAKEYVQAAQLDEKERKVENLWRILTVISWSFVIFVSTISGRFPEIDSLIRSTGGILIVCAVALYITISALIDYIRIPATWRTIILKGIARHQESAQQHSSGDAE